MSAKLMLLARVVAARLEGGESAERIFADYPKLTEDEKLAVLKHIGA